MRCDAKETLAPSFNPFAAGVVLAIAILSGCAPEPPRVPAGTPAPQDRCARVRQERQRGGARESARKLSGSPAYLTPEGIEAGVPNAVHMRCLVTREGLLEGCTSTERYDLPISQEQSIALTLKSWRFQPARINGDPITDEQTVLVPLVEAPPGWALTAQAGSAPVEVKGGISLPQLVSGPVAASFTQEAREACVEGKVIARCTITEEGTLVGCRIVKGLPFLDQAVLATLAARKYTPAMYQGKPIRVYYTFSFNFVQR